MLPVEKLDLSTLPKKPRIDEANYGWTGSFGDYPCLLIGHRELRPIDGVAHLDTRQWEDVVWAAPQKRRLKKFLETAPEVGETILVYVYEDIGIGTTSTGEHQAKRGAKRVTGKFRILDRTPDWFLARLIERD